MKQREKAEQALWFAQTYGLMPMSLHLQDAHGEQIEVSLKETGK